ncbi:cGMP-dependent protein kinase, isozyme 1 [Hypsibius exemplaris]|uniref:cGMP-dependent protein kinase n=1 Tax=Hypsibius exemplaris TaxID=2072580 RepID=A0A9X6NC12_HYPEX|nr:cGMP-dependent protein kinase, isozyme 1 [Hypsibius exemplaris]
MSSTRRGFPFPVTSSSSSRNLLKQQNSLLSRDSAGASHHASNDSLHRSQFGYHSGSSQQSPAMQPKQVSPSRSNQMPVHSGTNGSSPRLHRPVGQQDSLSPTSATAVGGGGPVSPGHMTAEAWFIRKQQYELLIEQLQQALETKDHEIELLKKQLDKAKSVLSVTNPSLQQKAERAVQGTTIDEDDMGVGVNGAGNAIAGGGSQDAPKKKQGVSGESSSKFSLGSSRRLQDLEIAKVEKDFRSKHLIKDALYDNDFLANLDSTQTREIIDYMYPIDVIADSYIIQQGDEGNHLYVLAEGEAEAVRDDKLLGKITPGKAFGELAILYNCTRTASVKALTDTKLWVLDRSVFQVIMMRSGLQRQEEIVNFLRSVPDLKNLDEEKLAKVADALEVEYYSAGNYVIHEGETGDTFFVLYEGQVKVTQKMPGKGEPQMVRLLEKGCYFGEKALLQEERRTATIIAITDVECLTLDRDSFVQLIGDLRELKERDYGDEERKASSKETRNEHRHSYYHNRRRYMRTHREKGPSQIPLPKNEYSHVQLTDVEVLATLGQGGFGRVLLVQLKTDPTKTFALKCMKKMHVVKQRQQEHVLSEKNITLRLNNPFVCRMYATFKDRKYLYMMMEACLGGELWTILRDRNYFEEDLVRFYTACAVLALEYLHDRCIIYRDLKPENVLLDSTGYAKIADFGFAKDIETARKTWTFCGTPQYIAPEVILNKGHDHAVDYWALGIYVFELSTGNPPFDYNGDQLQVYNNILRGLGVVEFPRRISRNCQSLMKRLCKANPVERLGYQRNGISDIKRHKFFQGFDWTSLANRTLPPPIKPSVAGPTDVSNFDQEFPPDNDIPPDELSGWDVNF